MLSSRRVRSLAVQCIVPGMYDANRAGKLSHRGGPLAPVFNKNWGKGARSDRFRIQGLRCNLLVYDSAGGVLF